MKTFMMVMSNGNISYLASVPDTSDAYSAGSVLVDGATVIALPENVTADKVIGNFDWSFENSVLVQRPPKPSPMHVWEGDGWTESLDMIRTEKLSKITRDTPKFQVNIDGARYTVEDLNKLNRTIIDIQARLSQGVPYPIPLESLSDDGMVTTFNTLVQLLDFNQKLLIACNDILLRKVNKAERITKELKAAKTKSAIERVEVNE